MKILLHVEFMRSWAKLSAGERKQSEDMMARIRDNGITPGMRAHAIKNGATQFLSLSPNMDLRVLAWRQDEQVTLLYVDHHDKAYSWAERNAIPILGFEAIAFAEGSLPRSSPESTGATISREPSEIEKRLIQCGVPVALRRLLSDIQNEDEALDCLELVAPEWRELVLEAISGTKSKPSPVLDRMSNVWVAPNDDALRAALTLSSPDWSIFLHPRQLEAVDFPADRDLLITGGPGTGKTIALAHRAVRLSKSCRSGECVVLVGHSPKACDTFRSMIYQLKPDRPNSIEVVDMIAIGRDGRPRWGDVVGPAQSGKGHLQCKGRSVTSLLIDECQDIHGKFCKSFLFGGRPNVSTHLTAAIDFNQNIFADNRTNLSLIEFLQRAHVLHFSYSYRIPREVGMVALNLIASVDRTDPREIPCLKRLRDLSKTMCFGFSSDFIDVVPCGDILKQIEKASTTRSKLFEAGIKDVAIVFSGNRSTRLNWASALARLGYDSSTDSGLLTPRASKGSEFEHTIVVAPELAFSEGTMRSDFAFQSLYVTLSRCRRGVTIFTTKEFADTIRFLGVSLRTRGQQAD